MNKPIPHFSIRSSFEKCSSPFFACEKIHRIIPVRAVYLSDGLPGWIMLNVCFQCGKKFDTFFCKGKDFTPAYLRMENLDGMKRDEVVMYYREMCLQRLINNEQTKEFNDKIIAKWSESALTYIKNKAWKGLI